MSSTESRRCSPRSESRHFWRASRHVNAHLATVFVYLATITRISPGHFRRKIVVRTIGSSSWQCPRQRQSRTSVGPTRDPPSAPRHVHTRAIAEPLEVHSQVQLRFTRQPPHGYSSRRSRATHQPSTVLVTVPEAIPCAAQRASYASRPDTHRPHSVDGTPTATSMARLMPLTCRTTATSMPYCAPATCEPKSFTESPSRRQKLRQPAQRRSRRQPPGPSESRHRRAAWGCRPEPSARNQPGRTMTPDCSTRLLPQTRFAAPNPFAHRRSPGEPASRARIPDIDVEFPAPVALPPYHEIFSSGGRLLAAGGLDAQRVAADFIGEIAS